MSYSTTNIDDLESRAIDEFDGAGGALASVSIRPSYEARFVTDADDGGRY